MKISVCRVLINDKKKSLRPLRSLWLKNPIGAAFRSHAELRRRGGTEAGLAAMGMRKLSTAIRTPK